MTRPAASGAEQRNTVSLWQRLAVAVAVAATALPDEKLSQLESARRLEASGEWSQSACAAAETMEKPIS